MKVGEKNWNENGIRGCVGCERIRQGPLSSRERERRILLDRKIMVCMYVCMLSLLLRRSLETTFRKGAGMDEYVDLMQGR